jgi:hypothetical protein
MGQVLHGSATTAAAVRRTIQHSKESLRALAKRYGINQKTVAKWKGRTSVADLSAGLKEPRSTVLSVEEEALVIAFRKHTHAAARRLPLRASASNPAPEPRLARPLSVRLEADAIAGRRRDHDNQPAPETCHRAGSWHKERRAVARIEAARLGLD